MGKQIPKLLKTIPIPGNLEAGCSYCRPRGAAVLNILVVDDEPGIRSGLAYSLSDGGHRVVEANDGAAALKLIAEQVFDVVICDVRLPKVDGLTLLRRLHDDSPSTAVVMMTGYAKVADAMTALRAGAYDYVTKPFDSDDFPMNVI